MAGGGRVRVEPLSEQGQLHRPYQRLQVSLLTGLYRYTGHIIEVQFGTLGWADFCQTSFTLFNNSLVVYIFYFIILVYWRRCCLP